MWRHSTLTHADRKRTCNSSIPSSLACPTGTSSAVASSHPSGIGRDLGRQAVEANLRFKSVPIDFAAAQ
jgi:hypothetical protein